MIVFRTRTVKNLKTIVFSIANTNELNHASHLHQKKA